MPVCIKKAQTHHLDLRFLPLDGIIIFAFLYFVKGEFSKIMPLAGTICSIPPVSLLYLHDPVHKGIEYQLHISAVTIIAGVLFIRKQPER